MDLADAILALVAPTQPGDELAPGLRLVHTSTELGPRLTFRAGEAEVHVEIEPLDLSRPHAARSAALMFSYRAGDAGPAIAPGLGLALCRTVARIAAPRENAVLAALREASARTQVPGQASARIREVRIERLLQPAGTPEQRFFTLSPYVGCLIGCRFCYAQSRLGVSRALAGLPLVPWGSYVDVRVNAPEVLARELSARTAQERALPIKFCPIVSDPYQAVERSYQITRRCLEVLRDGAFVPPVLVLTRSALLARDAELLATLPGARAGVSLPTVDEAVLRHFEPRGATASERLDLLRTLRRAGVETLAVVQPLLPGSVTALADALAETASSVSLEVLHGAFGASEEFRAPAYAEAASPAWQHQRATELEAALRARGVRTWQGDLPPS